MSESYEARVHSAFGGREPDVKDPETLAWLIRRNGLEMTHLSRGSHIGSVFSVAEIIAVLYARVLRVDPKNPGWPERDRLILSKGHAGSAVYSALAESGFFPVEELKEHYANGSRLSGHVSHKGVPGVEVSTGALGHGLSIGVGMALAAKMQRASYKTYVVMGDGEQAEGSIYEAAMAANKYHLDNLVAIIDRNGLQISGSTEDVMPLESIRARWEAFGWDVKEINGDDVRQIVNALDDINWNNSRPHLIISDTTKGYGISYMENVAKWHHGVPNEEQYEVALSEIDKRIHQLYNEGEKE